MVPSWWHPRLLLLSCLLLGEASGEASLRGGYSLQPFQKPYAPEQPYCPGACLPPVLCSPALVDGRQAAATCLLAPGTPGACCTPTEPSYVKRELLQQAPYPAGSKSPYDFDTFTLDHAAKVGIFKVNWVTEFEQELSRRSVFVKQGSAGFMHFAFFRSKSEARAASDDVSKSIYGSQDLKDRFRLTAAQAGFGLKAFSIKGTILEDKCPVADRCDPSYPYRSYNASCNNLVNPLWGTSGSPFQRTVLPEYSDGVWAPKVAKSGTELPSARLISINIIPDVDIPDDLDTHNVMQWGQFVDHDLTHTPLFRLSDTNSSGVKCCAEDGSASEDALVRHPACFPIDIPSNDPFFKKHDQRCMNFVRSMPGPGQDCTFGYTEQMNQITHLLDSSMVYGSDEEDAIELRMLQGGLMKAYKSKDSPKELLPQEEGELEGEQCAIQNQRPETKDRKCFKAGDSRSNEHTGLVAYHTVWLREHNRLARELAALNPHWVDERLYQEARRILVAEMQHITYNEWLPIILGTGFMEELDILPLTHGHSNKYSNAINPTILNSFATAAFRFGHTLIQGMMDLVKEMPYDRKTVRVLPLSDQFQNPELVYSPGGLDKFLVGLATQPSQKFDNIVTEEVTNHLFQGKDKQFGMDLISLNLQRGRDHGLQGYTAFRELCGFGGVNNFADLADLIPMKIVERLKLIYDDVEDVDLFIGGISEAAAVGSLVGPTFRCLVGDQFKRLQHGDRFYYDSSASPMPFTTAQLQELRRSSLARVTCDNGDAIRSIQPLAFRTPSTINPLVPCDAITIPIMDLLPWQEGYLPPPPATPHHLPPQPYQPYEDNLLSLPAYGAKSSALKQEQYHPSYYSSPPQHSFDSSPPADRFAGFASPSMRIKPFVHRGVHTPLHRFHLATRGR